MSDPIDIVERLREALADDLHAPLPWIGAGPSYGQPMPVELTSVVTDTEPDSECDMTICRDAITPDVLLICAAVNAAPVLLAEIDRLRAALAQPAAVSADAEDWLRERFGVVRGHPEWRALIEAFDAGKVLAQPAAPGVTADDYFTLLGHAMTLRMEGQTDMPAYLYGLAERIAPDAEHAARARQLAAAPQAPQPGAQGANAKLT